MIETKIHTFLEFKRKKGNPVSSMQSFFENPRISPSEASVSPTSGDTDNLPE